MINKRDITIDWLERVSKNHHNADKILTEKVIRALLLLEGLVMQGIPFVFKGGTALMLHFSSTRRLSIDIDIIVETESADLATKLEILAHDQGFGRVELQHRDSISTIKKAHYKFYYSPLHRTNKEEEYVLLDVLFEKVNYKKVISIPIQSDFVPQIDSLIEVYIPSLEDILGDKLTAFAPNTTGIPYFKTSDSMSMEIIKQLYDIGTLFDVVTDLDTIKSTFLLFAKAQIGYRAAADVEVNDVLDDIFNTALCITSQGTSGLGNFEELQRGVQRVRSFIFSENYHLDKATTHASKAAYLSKLISMDATYIEKYDRSYQMSDWLISDTSLNKLNKLKKSNPEAFFYWYKIFELTKL